MKNCDTGRDGEPLNGEDPGKSVVAPDHYAAEAGFVEVFLEDEDLLREFPLYAREFLKHEGAKLEEYRDVNYGVGEPGVNTNGIYLCERIVSLMYQAAKKGSSYARGMMVYIYKNYYKAEYNRLKRFQTLSWNSLNDLAEEWVGDDIRVQLRKLTRYLCMAPLLNITLLPDCDDFYPLIGDTYYVAREQTEERNSFQLTADLLEESRTEVAGWLRESEKCRTEKDSRKLFPQWWRTREFTCCCLEYLGYSRDYLTFGTDMLDSEEMELNMVKTRAILKKRFKAEPTYEEVQSMAVIFEFADKLLDEINTVSDTVDNFLGLSSGYAIAAPEKPRFNLERLNAAVKSSESSTGTQNRKAVKAAADQHKAGSGKREEDKDNQLLAEIEQLRMKLHNLEQENEHLRENNKKMRELSDTIGILRQQQADDRRELHALREHVYKLTEKGQDPEADIAEMEKAVSDKRIVIIGGIDSWSNRLKAKFENWKFISTDISALVDMKIFDGADRTYFFTDYLAHRTYVGYVKALRERRMPFGYIHSTNYENNIKQIYEDTHRE
ncbi:MAG: hypothetical protein LUH14_07670 [Clostridiaceae bacterium]|nr:hypothetical protein [Clostridiaceae bacterium]